jgi:hypothetical protein
MKTVSVVVLGVAATSLLSVSAVVPAASATGSGQVVSLCGAPAAGHVTCLGLLSRAPSGAKPDGADGGGPIAFGPADLQSAYNITSAASTRGAGQRIYVSVAFNDATLEPDLTTYRNNYGLPACTSASGCLQVLNQDGHATPLPPNASAQSGWATQTAVEVDMISAICPHCGITVMEADDDEGTGLLVDIATATSLGAKFVVIPWGSGEDNGDVTDDATYFASRGVAYVAAGGDQGYGVDWPASSPDVISVGGTHLVPTGGSGRGWMETAWTGTSSQGGSGSGCSSLETAKPSWQSVIPTAVCAHRADNDVAAVADPATPVRIYDSSEGGWQAIGGTTVGAAIIAAVYALAGTPPASSHPAALPYADRSALNDVTSNAVHPITCSQPLLCNASAGWDGPTGLGTPNGLAAFTPPADASALSTGKAATIADGKSLTLTTTATDTKTHHAIAGAHVRLFARSTTTTAFVAGRTVTASATGKASVRVAPKRNTVYEWRLIATAQHAAAASGTTMVKVSQVATVTAKPNHVKHGKHFTVYGTVSPAAAGEKVTVQWRTGKAWHRAGTAKLRHQRLPSGKTAVGYAIRLKEPRRGKYSFRALVGATKANAAGTSRVIKITVT